MGIEMGPIIRNRGMSDAFQQLQPLVTVFHAIPFDGSEPLEFTAPEPFTYVHLVNAYQNETAIVIDMNILTNAEPWIAMGDLHILLNKTRRDANAKQEVWRYALHLAGPQTGNVTRERITKMGRGLEFPKINMQYSTQKHCIYYCQEWFHNGRDLGSMAVLKHDVCQGIRNYRYLPSHFPTEANFIPSPDARQEDDGVLVFSETDGLTGVSSFVMLNATTMEPMVEQPLPVRVTFTTHGQWYDGIVGRTRPDPVHVISFQEHAIVV